MDLQNNATQKDFEKLRNEIVDETGFDLSLDIFNWIVFLSSKKNKIVPISNRYFGVKQDGQLKIRGIETRCHDTPKLFKDCQMDILNLFTSCKTIHDIKKIMPKARSIQKIHSISITK